MAAKKRAQKAAKRPRASSPRAASKAKAGRKRAVRRPSTKKTAASTRTPGRSAAGPSRAPAASGPAAPRNSIGCTMIHLDYTTHAIDEVKRFYTETLGFRDFAEMAATQYLSVEMTPHTQIGFMPPMPGPPEQWRPPREPALYLMVKDVDRAWRDLTARGVAFQQDPTDMPWKHRVAILRDPEGRMVCLAQPLA